MAKATDLDLAQSHTFSDYFNLSWEIEDILAFFGYSFRRSLLSLPVSELEKTEIESLKKRLATCLPLVSLSSETARREVLIAPILLALIGYTQAQLRIEYPLKVSEQLKGTLDYYLYTQPSPPHNLLVIEAKKADLAKGFTQLAVELIALKQWLNWEEKPLYGAVSTGDVWQFGCLSPQKKQIEQDLNLFRVPTDLTSLFSTLMGVLTSPE